MDTRNRYGKRYHRARARPHNTARCRYCSRRRFERSTNKAGRRIYVEARCSEFGICVSCVLVADNNSFEAARKALQDFVDNAVLDQPRNVSIYEGFDWKKFLTDQMLVSYESNENATKLNQIHLCHDGSFQSSIKRKGLLKEDAKQYQGKKTGTWSIASGQTSVLKLIFKDGSLAEIELRIDDDKV